MSDQLRSLLEDVAATIDPVPLQRDPWRRAVRARRLGQLLSSIAALAVVVALIRGWLVWDRHRL